MWKSEFQDTRGAEGLNEFAWGDASGSWWRGDAKQKERNLGRPKLCPATSLHSSNLWLYFKSVPFHIHSGTAERAKATWMQSWGKELHLVDCGAEGKVSLGISTLIAIRPDIFSAHCWRNKKISAQLHYCQYFIYFLHSATNFRASQTNLASCLPAELINAAKNGESTSVGSGWEGVRAFNP